MTCIIGVSSDGVAYVGADSAAVNGYGECRASAISKVFRLGEFIVGYTSSFRMGQILQYHLDVPEQGDESDIEYMVVAFVEAVRECLKEHGYSRVNNNEETGGTFIVGYRGSVYYISDDFQVNQFKDGLVTCGSGREYALGAMKAMGYESQERRIGRALGIVAELSGRVCPPFTILRDDG